MVYISPSLKEIVRAQLEERGSRTGAEATRPITTVRCEALHDLQFRATVEGHSFIMDERKSSGGNDAGPAPMRYYAAGIMGSDHVWLVKTAALMDVSLDRLEGELSLYNKRIVYTVFIDSPSSDDQILDLVQGSRDRRGTFKALAHTTKVELKLVHNGKTILEQTLGE
jgi:uncharacterized OsmC-like protein